MLLANTLFALFSVSVLAETISTFASTQWTLESLSRVWDEADMSCTWTFGINTNEAGVNATKCNFTVKATKSAPASRSKSEPVKCDNYTITSDWSGQFGIDHGFTTISIGDFNKRLIAYPGYADVLVANGTVVKPDLSFPVQTLA